MTLVLRCFMDVFGWELYRVGNDCTNDCLVSSCDISDNLMIGEWKWEAGSHCTTARCWRNTVTWISGIAVAHGISDPYASSFNALEDIPCRSGR